MSNKEDLIRDISIVTTTSSKFKMSDTDQAEKMMRYFKVKQVFKTQIGIQYLERLQEIKMGKKDLKCFVCKTSPSYDGILCENCMKKYSRGEKEFYGKDDFTKLNDIFEDEHDVENLKIEPVNLNDFDNNSSSVKNNGSPSNHKTKRELIVAFFILSTIVIGFFIANVVPKFGAKYDIDGLDYWGNNRTYATQQVANAIVSNLNNDKEGKYREYHTNIYYDNVTRDDCTWTIKGRVDCVNNYGTKTTRKYTLVVTSYAYRHFKVESFKIK